MEVQVLSRAPLGSYKLEIAALYTYINERFKNDSIHEG